MLEITRCDDQSKVIADTYLPDHLALFMTLAHPQVKLKSGKSTDVHLKGLQDMLAEHPAQHEYELFFQYKRANGYAAKLFGRALVYVRTSPDVQSIDEDREAIWGPLDDAIEKNSVDVSSELREEPIDPIVSGVQVHEQLETLEQTETIPVAASAASQSSRTKGAPWGLARMTQNTSLNQLPSEYLYPAKIDAPKYEGVVRAYVLDTGVMTVHEQFGNRAKLSTSSFILGNQLDTGTGHGTHVAGIIGGATVGVDPEVEIISVKVLGPGSGAKAVTAAIQWVEDEYLQSGVPSIINMSLTFPGPGIPLVDAAANAAVASGVHVVAAAGNQGQDAGQISPARAADILTVGASDINDNIWSMSNFGASVKIFAPGVDIRSAAITGRRDLRLDTGTSMAAPHVAGLIAYLIRREGPKLPADMIERIIALANQRVPPNAITHGRPNTTHLLAYMG
ncbi:subtilisin-like serine protease [Ceratobasidium sp. 392]|nr:subtilisin-like serine protease [Ceratobasidium sp. 392]